MQNCPPEILDRVFALACTDNGSTGRALSLVSTKFHDISYPYKYHSLHVIGGARVSKFFDFVKAYKPPVQYLMMDCTLSSDQERKRSSSTISTRLKCWPTSSPEMEVTAIKVDAILRVLAPKLKGLYLIPPAAPLKLNSFTFPLLDTFYLCDYSYDVETEWDSLYFPSLSRLQVTCDGNTPHGHGHVYRQLSLSKLTHFGCCAHSRNGIILFLALLSRFAGQDYEDCLKNVSCVARLFALRALRVMVPSTEQSEVHSYMNQIMLLENCPLKHPDFFCDNHDTEVVNVTAQRDWQYVVEGGEGFSAAKHDYPFGFSI